MRRHAITGTVIAVGLFFLTATGLTWSTYAGENVANIRQELNWTTPKPDTTLAGAASAADSASSSAHAEHSGAASGNAHAEHMGGMSGMAGMSGMTGMTDSSNLPAQAQTVLDAAVKAGLHKPLELKAPTKDGMAWTATEIRAPWRMSNNTVAIDGQTGQITDTVWFKDWPLAAKLTAWGIQLHMGTLFGLVSQVIFAALALAICAMVIRGYMMWFQRRPTRGGFVGRAPRRGAWRTSSILGLVVVAVLVVAYAALAPLFAISLVAFLVLDLAIGIVKTLQSRRRNSVA